jgi:hypothetical protein
MRSRIQNFFVLGAGISLILVGIWASQHPGPSGAAFTAPSLPVETPTPAAPVSAPQQPKPDSSKFEAKLSETTAKMARPSDIRPEAALHDAPPETTQDSENFGDIMDDVKNNPALVPTVMNFYEKCAQNSEVLASSRAVCLAHLMYWMKKRNVPLDRTRYPREIISIAEKLPVQWE